MSRKVSIRAPREGGDDPVKMEKLSATVSIRAPREGGDSCAVGRPHFDPGFNPRPP